MLIVEDDADIREVLVELLRDEGYSVHAVDNGRSALEWLRRVKKIPEIILCDVTMPIMNGLEFVARLQEDARLRVAPVVLMSACRIPNSAQHVRGLPVLKKPFGIETLLGVIERYALLQPRKRARQGGSWLRATSKGVRGGLPRARPSRDAGDP